MLAHIERAAYRLIYTHTGVLVIALLILALLVLGCEHESYCLVADNC